MALGAPRTGLVRRTAVFNISASLVAAVTGILLARWLGPTGRGHYAAVTAYFGLMLILTEVGISASLVFYVAKWRSDADNYVRTAARILIPLGLVGSAVTFGGALLVLDDSDARRVPFLVLAICVILSLIGAPRSFALQALSISKWNIVRLSQPLVMIVLVVGYEIAHPVDVTIVVGLMAVAIAVQVALSWVLYAREHICRGSYKRALMAPMVRFGLSNAASTAPNSINARVDQLVLAVMVAPAILGQYAVAVTLSLLAGPLALAFGNVAFPRLARGGNVIEIAKRSVRGSMIVSILGVGVIMASSPFVVPKVFGDGYGDVTTLLVILGPGAVVFVVNQVIGDLLRGLGRPGIVARCEWFGLTCTVAGLYLFVPTFGAYGAAATSSVVYLIVHVLLRIYLHRLVSAHAPTHTQRKMRKGIPATRANGSDE